MRTKSLSVVLGLSLWAGAAFGQHLIQPEFSIWDVVLGQPVAQVPEGEVGEIACGTGGGPPGQTLAHFEDFPTCTPEPSGLREVAFNYDDEQDYIALALEAEYKFLRGGTSVFAHPVIVSLLVDPEGIVQGRRIVTDNRVSDHDRYISVTLIRNFKARYGEWSLKCTDIPLREGEQRVGNQFIHELCTGQSPDGSTRIAIEASLLRKKGQRAVNQETQKANTGYFESQTRFEEVLSPYVPVTAP
jgi:hypothetical protein